VKKGFQGRVMILIEKQVIYDGRKVRLEVHHLEDDAGKRVQKEVVIHPGAVVILPFLDEQTIVMIRNKRYAVNDVLTELPAGTLEKGEAAMNCAGRELLEETGYLAKRIKPLFSFYSSPGILSEKMHAFAAYDLQKKVASLDEGEEIEVESVLLDDAIEMIRHGEIVDAKTIAVLMMYDRFNRAK
jgi:ADP-ribose pyrophosphatase